MVVFEYEVLPATMMQTILSKTPSGLDRAAQTELHEIAVQNAKAAEAAENARQAQKIAENKAEHARDAQNKTMNLFLLPLIFFCN